MKQLALYTIIVFATLAGAALLLYFPEAVVMFLISLAVAATVRPMLDGLTARGLPSGVSVLLTFLLIVITLIGLIWGVSGLLVRDLGQLGDNLAVLYDRMWATWPHGSSLQQALIARLPPPEDLYSAIAGDQGGALVTTLMGVTTSSVGFLSQFFGALVLSIYWSADRIHFERVWLSLLPVDVRARWREVGRDVEKLLGSYIRSEVFQSLLVGLLLGGGFTLMGMPYPTALAVLAAVAWLLPWIGGVIAIIPVLIVALIAGFPLALVAPVFTLAVLTIMELVVEPRIASRRQYSPWLTVILLMVMGESLGLIGIILAPPLAAMIQITARRILQETQASAAPNQEIESARRIAELDERVMEVRQMIDKMEEPPSPQTISMLDRLSELVCKAQEISGVPQAGNSPTPR